MTNDERLAEVLEVGEKLRLPFTFKRDSDSHDWRAMLLEDFDKSRWMEVADSPQQAAMVDDVAILCGSRARQALSGIRAVPCFLVARPYWQTIDEGHPVLEYRLEPGFFGSAPEALACAAAILVERHAYGAWNEVGWQDEAGKKV